MGNEEGGLDDDADEPEHKPYYLDQVYFFENGSLQGEGEPKTKRTKLITAFVKVFRLC